MQGELHLKRDFRIVRLDETALRSAAHLRTLSELLLASEPMYPGIERWLARRVLPGLATGERIAYLGYDDRGPVASAIVKKGEDAKFCHLRVANGWQQQGMGELFFILMALDVSSLARSIHFTLPEGLWAQQSQFFASFAFSLLNAAPRQYRTGEGELLCGATFSAVWQRVIEKLPKIAAVFSAQGREFDSRLLLSIHPRHADAVLSGNKTVEVRRRFSARWIGKRLSLYATDPVRGLVGEATVADVTRSSPHVLWERMGAQTGCSKEEFMRYAGDASEVHAISLVDVVRYQRVVSLAEMGRLLGQALHPPQSYARLAMGSPLSAAASIAALLQEGVRTAVSF